MMRKMNGIVGLALAVNCGYNSFAPPDLTFPPVEDLAGLELYLGKPVMVDQFYTERRDSEPVPAIASLFQKVQEHWQMFPEQFNLVTGLQFLPRHSEYVAETEDDTFNIRFYARARMNTWRVE